MGAFSLEKFEIKRSRIFWLIQAASLLLILGVSYLFSLSYSSFSHLGMLCGILTAVLNMEILLRIQRLPFFFIFFKYLLLAGGLFFILPYLDNFSFLLGLSFIFSYLVGMSVEALK